jgi:hypothetical protein
MRSIGEIASRLTYPIRLILSAVEEKLQISNSFVTKGVEKWAKIKAQSQAFTL